MLIDGGRDGGAGLGLVKNAVQYGVIPGLANLALLFVLDLVRCYCQGSVVSKRPDILFGMLRTGACKSEKLLNCFLKLFGFNFVP